MEHLLAWWNTFWLKNRIFSINFLKLRFEIEMTGKAEAKATVLLLALRRAAATQPHAKKRNAEK